MNKCKATMKLRWMKCEPEDVGKFPMAVQLDVQYGHPDYAESYYKLQQLWECDDGSTEWKDIEVMK